jgi:hypothetical protein
MAKLSTAEIRTLASSIVQQYPGGIRYSALLNEIAQRHPETPRNTIVGSIWDLETRKPTEVVKPSRGVYVPARGAEAVIVEPLTPSTLRESDFYEPFADFQKTELQEATEAFALGGAGLRGKWGTPDVIAVYRKLPSDRVAFVGEILAAEIKINPQDYVTAFGQAIAYRLFAARTYIVMPSTMPDADQERLDALCMLFGVGLVLFDLDKERPNFRAKARAQRYAPDMFYLNRFADQLHDHNKEIFNKLFPLS